MAKFLLPFILLVFSQPFFCNGAFTYTAVAPSHIIPGEPYLISTTLEKADNPPVTFEYELTSQQNSGVEAFGEKVKMNRLGHKTTTSIVSPDLLQEELYYLKLTATDVAGQQKQDQISVRRKTRKSAILVQTDKPIYKPGGTVKFRVFLLDELLRPFGNDTVVADITVFDPMGNVIKLWKSKEVPKERGFISEEFELSKEPVLGEWKMEVKADNATEKKHHFFSVNEYVLPKYKIEINSSPSFVTFDEPKFTAEISAMYSFGKPVNGECTVELSSPNNYFQFWGAPTPTPTISKTSKLEEGKGLAKIEFDTKLEFHVSRQEVNQYGKNFNIFASCTDHASGNVRNVTETIKMYNSPHKIELVEKPNHIIPGFPVNITLKLATHDNLPVTDDKSNALTIQIGSTTIYKSIPSNGLVPVSFIVEADADARYGQDITVTYKLTSETFWLSSHYSPSGSYVQLNLITESPGEGEPIEVNVKTSKQYQALNVVLVSRGLIIHSERINGGGNKEQTIRVTLPLKSSPKVKLIVYLLSIDNSIVSDVLDLHVKKAQFNPLEISVSDARVQPGATVSLSVKGQPNSVVGLRAVDQSVLLLKKDDDLTLEKLESFGDEYHSGSEMNPWFLPWDSDEMYRNFYASELGLMTNIQMQNEYEEHVFREQWHTFTLYRGQAGSEEISETVVPPRPQAPRPQVPCPVHRGISETVLPQSPCPAPPVLFAPSPNVITPNPNIPVRVRSIFPETWIWEDIENPMGQLTIHKPVPDTVTSWFISAFQLNQEHGLSLAQETQKLTVFQPFFIALNLPYSVVKGEVLFLQVLVHNYQEEAVTVNVTLENQENGFTFLEEENESLDKMMKEVVVNPSSISSVVFPIVPTQFGTMTLSAKATAIASLHSISGDAVRRTLIVRPPGIEHVNNSAVLINLLKNKVFRREQISTEFPERRVPDADFLKVQVVGDVLGGSIENLDKLIKLPTGCGEQNMVHFVPDIVILDYLNSIGDLSPDVETRAKRYLEKGYQRQLTYLRPDGSYSTFGERDRVGSTWLTAFVTRAFIQAKRYISIDDEVIKKSLRFLLAQQNGNGSFSEQGFVYDKSLQGGSAGSASKHLTITAYTLLAIVEAQKADINLQSLSSTRRSAEEIIMSGVNYLVEQTTEDDSLNDVYTANLISYLLQYINESKKGGYFLLHHYFIKLSEDLAQKSRANGTIHWRSIKRQTPSASSRYFQPKTNPASVEMTSYGLLTYLLRGKSKLSDTVRIAKWLMRQRNPEGGFLSTQDTVMGITALAKFAEAMNSKENSNTEVAVKLSYGDNNSHTFHIGKDNRRVLQEYILPANTREVSIEATANGKGTAMAQLTWTYYVEAVDSSPAFDLKTELTAHDQGKNLDMKIEFAYIGGGEESNMAILEANAPSGYAFDQEELHILRKDGMFKRYELEDRDSKLQLYFDAVENTETTLVLKAYRMHLVARHAQGVVKIYDYYDNTQAAQDLYDVPPISMCDLCETEKGCDIRECK